MSESWSTLSEIAELRMGETIIASDCDGFGLPIYSADTGNTPWNYSTTLRRKLSRGTIIVGARGSIGYPRMPAATHFGATQTTITVTPRLREVKGSFLLWSLRWADFSKIALQQAVPMLTIADLGRLRVRLFSEQEQTVITHILDTLDTQIRRTEEVIAKLEQVKQGLLTDLLTRGIDENGELRPSPEEAPELYQDSPMGWVPVAWAIEQIRDAALPGKESFVDGDWIEAPYIAKSGIRLIQTGNIGVGRFIDKEGSRKYITQATKRLLGCRPVYEGDLLICRLADPVGRACAVPRQAEPAITAVDCTIFRVDPNRYDRRFVLLWLDAPSSLERAAEAAAGSTRLRISRSALGVLPLVHPPIEEQRRIAETHDYVTGRIEAERKYNEQLRAMRVGLMDDLLTGRIRVTPLLEEAEQAVG